MFTFIFFLVTRKSNSQLPRKNAQKPQEVRQIKSHYIHQLPQRPTMAQNVKKLLRGPVEQRTTFSDENNKVDGSLDVSRTRVSACIPESGFYCGNVCRILVPQVSTEPLLGGSERAESLPLDHQRTQKHLCLMTQMFLLIQGWLGL